MFSALFSFLGGSVFRMLWGEISSFLNKRQDHEHEIELMKVQDLVNAAQHTRQQEAIRIQAELGIKTIQVAAEGEVAKLETDAWLEAVKGTTKSIGIRMLDAWNGSIRPFVATWSIFMITIHYYGKGFVLDENGWMVCSAALGIYLADRTLFKRGK